MLRQLRHQNKRVAAEAVTLLRDGYSVIKKGEEKECSYLTLQHTRNRHVLAILFDDEKAAIFRDGKFVKLI